MILNESKVQLMITKLTKGEVNKIIQLYNSEQIIGLT
jgi:hypothetical protein